MRRSTALAFAVLTISCSSNEAGPISNSLESLVSETRRYRGEVISHSEVLSIDGLFPVPDTGLILHYSPPPVHWWKPWTWFADSSELPSSSTIAISRDHSFRLVGETEGKDEDFRIAVLNARNSIERIRDLTQLAVKAAVDDAANSSVEDSSTSSSASIGGTSSDSSPPANGNAPKTPPSKITRLEQLNDEIENEKAKLDEALKIPGVIIAQWRTDDSSRASAEVDTVASASSSHSKAAQGYIILGGIRVTELFFGEDFKHMIAALMPSDAVAIRYAGITTYLVQARYVSYLSDLDTGSETLAKLDLSDIKGAAARFKLGAAKLAAEYYSKTLQQLGNRGDLGKMKWTRRPFCFMAGSDLAGDAKESEGWTTVLTQVAHPGRLIEKFGESYLTEYDPASKDLGLVARRNHCDGAHCTAWKELTTAAAPTAPNSTDASLSAVPKK